MLSFHNLTATFNVAYTGGAFSGSVTIAADSASLNLGSTVTSTITNITGTYALPGKTFSLTLGSVDFAVSSFVSVHADGAKVQASLTTRTRARQ